MKAGECGGASEILKCKGLIMRRVRFLTVRRSDTSVQRKKRYNKIVFNVIKLSKLNPKIIFECFT